MSLLGGGFALAASSSPATPTYAACLHAAGRGLYKTQTHATPAPTGASGAVWTHDYHQLAAGRTWKADVSCAPGSGPVSGGVDPGFSSGRVGVMAFSSHPNFSAVNADLNGWHFGLVNNLTINAEFILWVLCEPGVTNPEP